MGGHHLLKGPYHEHPVERLQHRQPHQGAIVLHKIISSNLRHQVAGHVDLQKAVLQSAVLLLRLHRLVSRRHQQGLKEQGHGYQLIRVRVIVRSDDAHLTAHGSLLIGRHQPVAKVSGPGGVQGGKVT